MINAEQVLIALDIAATDAALTQAEAQTPYARSASSGDQGTTRARPRHRPWHTST
jgi:hypothetical protein